jgi:hypothetical protein
LFFWIFFPVLRIEPRASSMLKQPLYLLGHIHCCFKNFFEIGSC